MFNRKKIEKLENKIFALANEVDQLKFTIELNSKINTSTVFHDYLKMHFKIKTTDAIELIIKHLNIEIIKNPENYEIKNVPQQKTNK